MTSIFTGTLASGRAPTGTTTERRAALTFDPELLDVRLHAGRLEADAERGEHEQADEEHLARVPLHEAAQVEQMPLQLRPQPQGRLVTRRLALQREEKQQSIRLNAADVIGRLRMGRRSLTGRPVPSAAARRSARRSRSKPASRGEKRKRARGAARREKRKEKRRRVLDGFLCVGPTPLSDGSAPAADCYFSASLSPRALDVFICADTSAAARVNGKCATIAHLSDLLEGDSGVGPARPRQQVRLVVAIRRLLGERVLGRRFAGLLHGDGHAAVVDASGGGAIGCERARARSRAAHGRPPGMASFHRSVANIHRPVTFYAVQFAETGGKQRRLECGIYSPRPVLSHGAFSPSRRHTGHTLRTHSHTGRSLERSFSFFSSSVASAGPLSSGYPCALVVLLFVECVCVDVHTHSQSLNLSHAHTHSLSTDSLASWLPTEYSRTDGRSLYEPAGTRTQQLARLSSCLCRPPFSPPNVRRRFSRSGQSARPHGAGTRPPRAGPTRLASERLSRRIPFVEKRTLFRLPNVIAQAGNV